MVLVEHNVRASFFLLRVTGKLVLFLSVQLHSWCQFIHGFDSLFFLAAFAVCGSVEFFDFENELVSKFAADGFVEELFLVLDLEFMLGFSIDGA